MPGVWQPTTGAMLGSAMGAIRIDTSDVERAGTVTKITAKEITDAFAKVDQAAKKPHAGLVALSNDIQKVRGEIVALSAGAGVLTGIGLATAGNLQVARVQLSGLLGGLQQSTAYTEQLRKKAKEVGMPFNEMLKIATTLLPVLKGNTAELDRYANIADRLSLLKPELGAAGAAEALRLAVGSGGEELGRLGRTFGIASQDLQDAIKQTSGDLAAALDLVLNKMGATNEAANLMDRTWPGTLARTKDAAGNLLAVGFTPLLNTLIPILENTTQWAQQVAETNPELATMAAGMLATVAAGGPMLLMLSQVIQSLQTIKTLGVAGTLGKAAGVGLSVAGGIGLGVEGARGIGRATGNEQLANAGLGDVWRILKETVLVVSTQILQFGANIGSFILHMQQALGNFIVAIANATQTMAEIVGKLFPNRGAELSLVAKALEAFGQSVHLTNAEIEDINAFNQRRIGETVEKMFDFLFPETRGPGAGAGGPGGGASPVVEEFTADQVDAFAQFQQDMKDLEEQGAEQRLRINEQYQEAVANIEERLADMRKRIAKAEQDAAEQEAKREEDYQRSRQEVIEDAREADIEASRVAARRKERDEREHQNNLLDAASRFDALGIIREMRAFSEKRRTAEEDEREATQQRQDQLVVRLAQEDEAHNREMDELRQANRERLNEMRQEYAEEFQAAQLKLAKMREAHIREIQDLDQKLAREREARQRAFVQQFNDLSGSLNNQIQINRQGQSQMLADLRAWWSAMVGTTRQTTAAAPTSGSLPPPPDKRGTKAVPMAEGGPILQDMLVWAHKEEEMIKPDVARQIRYAMGGAINQPALAAAVAGGTGGGVSIGSVTIPIYGAPGQPVEGIRDAVRDALADIIDKYNKSVSR